jgi:hypothetical protein
MGSPVLGRGMNRLCKIALVIFLLLAAEAFAGWTEPVNMGPKINSNLLDADPCISTDGRFFFLSRHGTGGLRDIYFCEMTDTGWTTAQRMPNPINSNASDRSPFFTRDGTRLYFASDRSGSLGWYDIWYADYDTLTGEWGEPAVCDTPLNSPNSEWSMSLRGDNRKIYFSNGGPLGPLTVATWNSQNWGNLKRLTTLIDTRDEEDPDITADGNTIFFTRWILHTGQQIFYSTKYDTGDNCWNEAIRLPDIINDPPAMDPFISHDGTRLYFVAERSGGSGSCDIYYSDYRLDVGEDVSGPSVSSMLEAHPNPFNTITTISIYIPRIAAGKVELKIYDVRGRLIRCLLTWDGSWGYTEITWDGRTREGRPVASGIYFCVVSWSGKVLKSARVAFVK